MSKILFFEPELAGHRVEYIHHEVVGAARESEKSFVFVLPQEFNRAKSQFEWPDTPNVSYLFLTEDETCKCNCESRSKRIWAVSRTAAKYARREHADHLFMNTLVDGMPFLPFFLPSQRQLILLKQTKDELSWYKKRYYSFIYWLYKRHKAFSRILLVNDGFTASSLNSERGCNKFECLPDPITDIDREKVRDIRAEYGIGADKTVYLLFPIAKRKHVLDILSALESMDISELKDKAFIFTGKLDKEIQDEFHSKIHALLGKCQIVTVEGIIPYETLFNFCYSSDVYFTLYDNYHMSSGVLGYCAYFNKSVISIGKGLLGHLVRTYGMGACINNIDANSIMEALRSKPTKCHSDYVETHTIECFNKVILGIF